MHTTADPHEEYCELRNRTQNRKKLAGSFGDLFNTSRQSAIGKRAPRMCASEPPAPVLTAPSTPVILVALSACGLGVANIIPVIFSTAGRLGHADGGKTMSLVLTMGYAGILIGPALIGFVAEIATLTWSLSNVIVAMVVISLCGHLLRGDRT